MDETSDMQVTTEPDLQGIINYDPLNKVIISHLEAEIIILYM